MSKKDLTEIVVVLDRSGSMGSIQKDMEGGFDKFIQDQCAVPGPCNVTLTQFDTEYEVVYSGRPLTDVPKLVLAPRGSTALHDAMGKTINDTGARLAALPEDQRPERVLFVVISDGHENASREYTHDRVADMIKHQQEKYNWQFVYFGANQDAVLVAQSLNITRGINFAADEEGVAVAMNNFSGSTQSYRSGGGYT